MFNEENTVEQLVPDTLCGGVTSNMVAKELASDGDASNTNQGDLLHGI
ncbi:hypothetical protein JWJ90_15695 [Desulfobulbus rhabdoformis]|jgi:type I restriction enzyme R subunit|nr:hypothetical protein [Desulfobulbus rhabdoformis]MBM9615712.1 hypothetical protein [Desulfobulbus rhabdoformis]